MGVVIVKLFGDKVIPTAKFGIPAPGTKIGTAQTRRKFINKISILDGRTVGPRHKPALHLVLAVSGAEDFVTRKHLPAQELLRRLDLSQGDINEMICEQ